MLREHIRSYHAEVNETSNQVNLYECEVCDSFISSKDLYSHLVHHSDENTAKSAILPVSFFRNYTYY